MARDDYTLIHPIRVRWAEVDRQDVVFNGHYFLYFDVAVGEYWRAIGQPYPAGYIEAYGSDVYAVKATAEYHGSATYDDVLDVGCRLARFGRTSATFSFAVWNGATHLTSGEIVYVNADPQTRRSVPWAEAFRAKVRAFERTPPLE